VLADLLTSGANNGAHALRLSAPLPSQLAVDAVGETDLVFKIDGWSVRDDLATDGGSATPARDKVWVSVNRSWRTAWR